MTFEEFRNLVSLSQERICRDYVAENPGRLRVKRKETAVKNLVKIFDATLAISNEKGFQAMSVRDLSRSTGLSMGALYTYFDGKEQLLDMIQGQGRQVVVRILLDAIDGGENPLERLRRAIRTHLYLSEVLRPWFYFTYMETKNLSRENRKKAIEAELFTERLFAGILDAGRDEGCFRTRNAEMTAALIKAMLQDWYLKRWKYQRRGITVEAYGRLVMEMVEAFVMEKT